MGVRLSTQDQPKLTSLINAQIIFTSPFFLLSVVSRDFLIGTNSRTVPVDWQPVVHIQLEEAEAQSVPRPSISLPTMRMNQKVCN